MASSDSEATVGSSRTPMITPAEKALKISTSQPSVRSVGVSTVRAK